MLKKLHKVHASCQEQYNQKLAEVENRVQTERSRISQEAEALADRFEAALQARQDEITLRISRITDEQLQAHAVLLKETLEELESRKSAELHLKVDKLVQEHHLLIKEQQQLQNHLSSQVLSAQRQTDQMTDQMEAFTLDRVVSLLTDRRAHV